MSSFVIRFGNSRSKHYSRAVELAASFQGYSFSDSSSEHVVEFDESSLDEFFSLVDIVGGWVSSSIFIDGIKTTLADVELLKCYQQRLNTVDKEVYCRTHNFGPYHEFPCRQIWTSRFHVDGLTKFGKMDTNRIFHIDKHELQRHVMKESSRCAICPAFNINDVEAALQATPETVNPVENKDWEYVHTYKEPARHYSGVRMKTPSEIEREKRKKTEVRPKQQPLTLWQRIQLRLGRKIEMSPMISIGTSMNIRSAKDAKKHGIQGAQWSAELRGDVCPLCLFLDGRTISVDHPDFDRFIPPLHSGCKCFRVYIGDDEQNVKFDWQTPSDELIQQHAPHLKK